MCPPADLYFACCLQAGLCERRLIPAPALASTTLSLNATLGNPARAAGKSLYLWQVHPGLWRFLIVGLNQTALADGALVNLFVSFGADAFPATYPLQLLNIVATDPSAQPVAATETDGSVAVQGGAGSALPLQSWGVLNGASLLPGPVAPGEIVTLFGSAIGPATVSFDGVPAPILYAGPSQINLVVPYEVQNKPNTQVKIVQGGQAIAQIQVPVADASPAIFAADGSGAGPGGHPQPGL
jgi:hypothetical protein